MSSWSQRGAQLTVRGWQAVVLSTMGLLVVVGSAIGALLLNRTDDLAHELIVDIQPARVAAAQLQAAVRDQETGVRGYQISADPQFLTPYSDGIVAEQAAAEEIRRRLHRPDLLADLNAVEAATGRWRTNYAEPVIAAVKPREPQVVSPETAARGKAVFDDLRTYFDRQNAHLLTAREESLAQLDRTNNWRDWVLTAMILIFVLTAGLLGVLIQRAVTRPLATLAAACRRITDGHFEESITPPSRPRDIRGIATDVENMRQQIVTELDATRMARLRLDEQATELRRSNAELEQFAYVASHDLQEPLRKVASFCQLLEKRYRDKLDDRGVEYIDFAVDGAKRMQKLINDLLSFSRVGRLNAKHAEVHLDTTLDMALGNLATAIEETGAQIVRPTGRLPQVMGDSTLLTQVWQNLIGNAVKFRSEGSAPRIVIDCAPGAGDLAGCWVLTVSDNGIGIPEEFSDKVFVIFQRLHGRNVYTGTGLGLALCKKIVEHHGGAIKIDTTYSGGTRFVFTLPVAAPSDGATARQETLEGAST